MPHSQTTTIDTDTLMAFVFRAVDEVGAALNCALVVMGDRLGYYRALADDGPMTAAALAAATGTAEPYAREWLNAQAAGAFVTYEPSDGTYALPPEHVIALTDESSPAFLPGFFQIAHGTIRDADRILAAAPDGDGLGWHDHNTDVHDGCERFFRPGYNAHLVAEWIPAIEGLSEKLTAGARVADIGCGHGASTVLMAQAFPASRFVGSDYHAASIGTAVERAADAGVADRIDFEVAPATEFSGNGYDLVTTFDALHDMGDPVGAAKRVHEALAPDGVWLLVEPAAGDSVEDNLNPVGRAYYGFSTLLCTPASLSQPVGAALGTQAGPARIRDVTTAAGFSSFRHRGLDPVQQRLRGATVTWPAWTRPVREDSRGAGRHPALVRRARVRAGHRRPAAQLVDRAVADVEGAGSVPRPPAPRGHLRRAGQRQLGPTLGCGGVRQRRVRGRHDRGHGCRGRRPRGAGRALQRRRVGGPGGGRAPRAGAGRGRDRAALASWQPRGQVRARHVRRPAGVDAGLGEVQPAPLARRRLRRLRRVLLRPDVPRAALDPAARGGQRVGARGRPADPRRLHVRSPRPRRRRAHRPRARCSMP